MIMAHVAAVRAHRIVDLHSIGVAPRVHKRLYQPVVRTCRRCIGGAHTPYDLTTNECARSSPVNHCGNTQHCTVGTLLLQRATYEVQHTYAQRSGAACDGCAHGFGERAAVNGWSVLLLLLLRVPIDWHDDRSHWLSAAAEAPFGHCGRTCAHSCPFVGLLLAAWH